MYQAAQRVQRTEGRQAAFDHPAAAPQPSPHEAVAQRPVPLVSCQDSLCVLFLQASAADEGGQGGWDAVGNRFDGGGPASPASGHCAVAAPNPYHPSNTPAKGDLCATLPPQSRRASDPSFPHPHSRHSRAGGNPASGARGEGPPPQHQSKRHSPPRSYQRVPQSNQSPILHFPASVSAKKRLHYHTKLNIQTRSARLSWRLTPWREGALG